jgi:hypothetical protein
MVDANQIVYQDESYPLEVCVEITYAGSIPVLTTHSPLRSTAYGSKIGKAS